MKLCLTVLISIFLITSEVKNIFIYLLTIQFYLSVLIFHTFADFIVFSF